MESRRAPLTDLRAGAAADQGRKRGILAGKEDLRTAMEKHRQPIFQKLVGKSREGEFRTVLS